ncbi:hypothetical protein BJ322DRAFT_486796 [Thelephora terrestris]|uniref:Uncharacterized protein n=1 Tax=Thelephora terrestris TaxID=56493 RepID=A0A9P6H555_9AGAM|nr:hypothetical protein BJ322DRAFT_486796 [Thelephora terrestris]
MVSAVVGKVLSRDFVRRYPLIFGSWRNFLGAEIDMFPQVVQPILNIISRSQNPAFQKQCRMLLRSLRRSNNAAYENSMDRLRDTIGSSTLDGVSALPRKDNEKVLLVSLQRLHRTLFRADCFRSSVFIPKSDDPLCNPDHPALSLDALLKYDDSDLCEDEDCSPLDSSGTIFMDLFAEPESSQDTENMEVFPVISTCIVLLQY